MTDQATTPTVSEAQKLADEIERASLIQLADLTSGASSRYLDADERAMLLAALRAMPEAQGWRPIESAPKDGTKFLVPYPLFNKDNTTSTPDDYEVIIVHWNGTGFDTGFWCLHEKPTRWMPLPAPSPQEVK